MNNVTHFSANERTIQEMLDDGSFANSETLIVIAIKNEGEVWVGRSWEDNADHFRMIGAIAHSQIKWAQDFIDIKDKE